MKVRSSSSFLTGRPNRNFVLLNQTAERYAAAYARLEAEYAPLRRKLRSAGLDESLLRQMDPDDRVATLERAKLDPYDYIYLAC